MTGAEAAAALREAGRGVLVMIVEARGSTPRGAGAAMLATEDGLLGTIGGGRVEHACLAEARARLACRDVSAEEAAFRDFPLGPALDQCCGGFLRVAFARLTSADAARFAAEEAALWPGGPVWRGEPPPRPALVYGAGHVGRALIAALAPLPFALRWIDARPGATARAPAGVEAVETPLPEAEAAGAAAGAFHVVLTHSHALDLEIVAAALGARPGFVGLIGSATKRATFARRLRERGVDPAGMTCPIGLPGVRDKRPAVIAASVAADLLRRDAEARAGARAA